MEIGIILVMQFWSLETWYASSKFDFTLSDDSPAAEFGFKPIKGFTASGKE